MVRYKIPIQTLARFDKYVLEMKMKINYVIYFFFNLWTVLLRVLVLTVFQCYVSDGT